MNAAFWPIWLAAPAIAAVGLLHWRMTGKLLGGSSAYAAVLEVKEESRLAEIEARMEAEPDALEAAMLEATKEAFGAEAMSIAAATPLATASGSLAPPPRTPWSAHLVFLACLMLGGALSAWRNGGLEPHLGLDARFAQRFGSSWESALLLVGGGLFVGFGTRMAGGCTFGHGISGNARLQRGSLVTTACFFLTGMLLSVLFTRWLP